MTKIKTKPKKTESKSKEAIDTKEKETAEKNKAVPETKPKKAPIGIEIKIEILL